MTKLRRHDSRIDLLQGTLDFLILQTLQWLALDAAVRSHRRRPQPHRGERRVKLPLWRRRQDDELDEELAGHLRMAIADRIARSESPEEAARAQVRKVIAAKDPEIALYDVKTMEQLLATSVASPRFQALLLALSPASAWC